jgi:3-phenylpropionate/trans-cinnamate dioxygenase ferredoxin reductase component
VAPERIVIIGSGDCGTRAAVGLRDRGYDGAVTLIGDGVRAPYERPALSKEVLTDDAGQPRTIAEPGRLYLLSAEAPYRPPS